MNIFYYFCSTFDNYQMTFGYIRVSSDRQTVENQRYEIRQFCAREGLEVDGWIEETVSGTKAYSKRRLGKLLKHVGKGDLIICSELSRLGRSLYMIMEILSYLRITVKGCISICYSELCHFTILPQQNLKSDTATREFL